MVILVDMMLILGLRSGFSALSLGDDDRAVNKLDIGHDNEVTLRVIVVRDSDYASRESGRNHSGTHAEGIFWLNTLLNVGSL